MKPIGRMASVLAMAFCLSACDLFYSFAEMNAQLEKVSTEMKPSFGSDPTNRYIAFAPRE